MTLTPPITLSATRIARPPPIRYPQNAVESASDPEHSLCKLFMTAPSSEPACDAPGRPPARSPLLSTCLLDRLPHAGRRRRHVEVCNAERRERIEHRADRGARCGNGPGLAGALDAKRIGAGRRIIQPRLDIRQIFRPRQAVVHQRSAEELARAALIDAMLEQRLAEPLRDRAHGLAVHDHRVHSAADVVDRDIAHQNRLPGLRVDLDLAYMAAVWPRDLLVAMQFLGRERLYCREFLEADAAVGARNDETPGGIDDVLDGCFRSE